MWGGPRGTDEPLNHDFATWFLWQNSTILMLFHALTDLGNFWMISVAIGGLKGKLSFHEVDSCLFSGLHEPSVWATGEKSISLMLFLMLISFLNCSWGLTKNCLFPLLFDFWLQTNHSLVVSSTFEPFRPYYKKATDPSTQKISSGREITIFCQCSRTVRNTSEQPIK